MMHAGAPDMATGLAGQSVIDGAEQELGAEGEQEVEDVVAELRGLDDAGKGAAAAAQDPGTAQAAKGVEAGLGKAGFKGEQQGGEGADQQIGHRRRSP